MFSMPKVTHKKLKSGRFYEVTKKRLFGPNDVLPEQDDITTLNEGDLLQCDKVLILNDGHSGRGSYVVFTSQDDKELMVSARVGVDRKVPHWLKEAHPLRVLAKAAE